MKDAWVDRAVHATEVSNDRKSDGAAGRSKASVVPSDATAERTSQSKAKIELDFRTVRLMVMTTLSLTILVGWCVLFRDEGIYVTDYDAIWSTQDEALSTARDVDDMFVILRALFSIVIGGMVRKVLAAGVAEVWLAGDDGAMEMTICWFVRYAVPLPFMGITAQLVATNHEARISARDLAKHDIRGDVTARESTIFQTEVERTNTTETILRRIIRPPQSQLMRECSLRKGQRGNEYTNVGFDFLANDWQQFVLPEGIEPTKTLTLLPSPKSQASSIFELAIDEGKLIQSLFMRAVYSYVDAALAADTSDQHAAVLEQLKVDTVVYTAAASAGRSSSVDGIRSFIRDYFSNSSAWVDVLHATVDKIDVKYTTYNLSESVAFASISLKIRISDNVWYRELAEVNGVLAQQQSTWAGTGDLKYEIDVANECGPRTCGVQNRGLAPEPKIVVFGDCSVSGGLDCDGITRNTSMLLAGFGRRIEGDVFELLAPSNASPRKAVLKSPREYHHVTMGRLVFKPQDLALKYGAKCDVASCEGVDVRFNDSSAKTTNVLIVGMNSTPMVDFGAPFDLLRNQVRGRPLVTRYTTAKRVDFEVLRAQNFGVYRWAEDLKGDACSGQMEHSVINTNVNNQFIENPLQVTYTTGLFFLFQNAQAILEQATERGSPVLLFYGSRVWYPLVFRVPEWQAWFGIAFGAIFFMFCLHCMRMHYRGLSEAVSKELMENPKCFSTVLRNEQSYPKYFMNLVITPPYDPEKRLLASDLILHSMEFWTREEDGSMSKKIVIR